MSSILKAVASAFANEQRYKDVYTHSSASTMLKQLYSFVEEHLRSFDTTVRSFALRSDISELYTSVVSRASHFTDNSYEEIMLTTFILAVLLLLLYVIVSSYKIKVISATIDKNSNGTKLIPSSDHTQDHTSDSSTENLRSIEQRVMRLIKSRTSLLSLSLGSPSTDTLCNNSRKPVPTLLSRSYSKETLRTITESEEEDTASVVGLIDVVANNVNVEDPLNNVTSGKSNLSKLRRKLIPNRLVSLGVKRSTKSFRSDCSSDSSVCSTSSTKRRSLSSSFRKKKFDNKG